MDNLMPYMVALYIRLSVEDSKLDGFSIENQKRALHQYVDTMQCATNIEVLEFVDSGYSGTNFERPAIQELLDLVRSGRINCIIVKDFTRFGRNSSLTRLGRDTSQVTKYWHLLRDLGVSVHTADCGEIDLSPDMMLRGMIDEMRKRLRSARKIQP